ncbi:class I SAM-dependent methyltransferase [Haliea atlantica]
MKTIDPEQQHKIKVFYDTIYHQANSTPREPSRHVRRLAQQLQIMPNQDVLDVACGTGEFLDACAAHGNSIAGVDISDTAVDECKVRLPQGEFHACPAEKLPFEDARFDVVTCLGSLEHFLDPVSALREMVRVAKPGAQFLILVPNKDFLTRRLGLYRGTYQVDAMEVVRSLDEWDALFREAGLAVRKRWKDTHVLSLSWIGANGKAAAPLRAAQAVALLFWPLRWQYQVYHLAEARN